MRFTLILLRRYLLPHETSLLTLALWISVAGVSLGIIQLMIVLSVMTGFQGFLQNSYTRITSPMVVVPRASSHPEDIPKALLATKVVKDLTPFAFGQAMILKDGVGGVTIEGIDAEKSKLVTPWSEIWVGEHRADLEKENPRWLWVGAQLANKLKITVGDKVNVFIPGKDRRITPFVVTAITKFGIYDHDLRYVYMSLPVLESLFAPDHLQVLYKTTLAPGVSLDDAVSRVERDLGSSVRVKRWSEINQNLFRAVQHQKWMLFAILEIVIGLAAMNVVNLLMMSSHHRRRDVAILRAMGMRLSGIFWFFVVQGASVGLVGIGLGIALGYVACAAVEKFQPAILSEKIYNVSRLPVIVDIKDVMWIAVGAFLVCVVFSVLPAIKAALARPVTALRQE